MDHPKFVQITSCHSPNSDDGTELFALDKDGGIWVHTHTQWIKMTPKRNISEANK